MRDKNFISHVLFWCGDYKDSFLQKVSYTIIS